LVGASAAGVPAFPYTTLFRSGGAGLQADILTRSSLGCHPLSVVTGVTVQDTVGVEDIFALDAEWVADQARCVLEDMPVSVFKVRSEEHTSEVQSRENLVCRLL